MDRFSLHAPLRKGPFRLLDELGADVGTVKGDLTLRMHGEVTDAKGNVVLAAQSPEVFGEDEFTARITDGNDASLGAVSKAGDAHFVRERWIVRNPVGEPVAVIEERGRLRALIASWRLPAGRTYDITRPGLEVGGGAPAPGALVGSARRSWLATRWHVAVDDDPTADLDRRHVLAAVAVMAIDQGF